LGHYSAAKAAAESLLGKYENRVCLRPGIIYGPGSVWWSDRIARLLVSRRLGNLGELGNGRCNLIHVDDVARAIVQAIRIPGIEGQAFNLANPSPPTWNSYFCQYAAALGVAPLQAMSKVQLTLELKLLAFPYKFGEYLESKLKILHPAPAIRPWLIKLSQHKIILDSRRAEQTFQLNWLPLDVGLNATARWFLSGGRA
jgi:nucleoside-diphosphate-sugar epimerase